MAARNKPGTLALTAGVAIIMAVLFANATISYLNTRQLVYNNGWVQHTFQVISELEITLSLLKDAETGQRGYLITHDRSYLEPYNQAVNEITGHIDKLAALTTDNDVQQRRIARLRPLVAERLRLAKENIDLEDSRKACASCGFCGQQRRKNQDG